MSSLRFFPSIVVRQWVVVASPRLTPQTRACWTLASLLLAFWINNLCRAEDPASFPPVPEAKVARYTALRAPSPLQIDGRLDEDAWRHAPRSPRFVDLISGKPTYLNTQAAVLWDDQFLYVGYWVEEPQVQAKFTQRDSPIYEENDVELFIAFDDAYYEFEINALGTIYEGLFAWQDRFAYNQFTLQPELDISNPNTRYQEFNGVGLNNHPRGKRWAFLQWDFPGLQSAVQIQGTLNDNSDRDHGWTVELAIPWQGMKALQGKDPRALPPRDGDTWRIDFSRFNQHKEPAPAQDSGGWAWSHHGVWDSHIPEVFPFITFSNQAVSAHWSNQTLRGFPDPLPPYQVQRVYPQLPLGKALAVGSIPNQSALWTITHDGDYGGPGRLYRFADNVDANQLDLILERPEILYGVAFHPRFAENGFIYLGCNGDSLQYPGKTTKVLRATVTSRDTMAIDPSSIVTIIEWPSDGHNGGDLAFGNDGMLYVSAGDGTSDSDGNLTGQDLGTIAGSMIRIDVDHPTENQLYSVPSDNPFVDTPGARPEIWAYGLRNPWRITYDLKTDQLWAGNNGQDLWETVHLIRRGENYGWSLMEGNHPFQPQRLQGPTPIVPATVEHPHSEARSLTGGVVYHGQSLPDIRGMYVYGDYATGNVWAVEHDGSQIVRSAHLARTSLLISGFGLDPNGELLIVDHQGGLYTLTPRPIATNTLPFPHRLSETGIYSDLVNRQLAPGFVPYSVNSPLWSDGAEKERFLAIPADSKIGLNGNLGWHLADQTVIVKNFSLPLASRQTNQLIETRLMLKVGNEWFGYSYQWDEAGRDATLVPAAGADATYQVHDPDVPNGLREQTWRFPSRIECTVCHTRAANYVLGLSTPQMNRGEQLTHLQERGWLDLPQPVDQLPRLVSPDDPLAPLEQRAHAYLVANCAHCHTNAGGGNSRMEMALGTPLEKMMLVDQEPQHDRFDIQQAKIIKPAAPQQSVLFHRLTQRGKGQMPPLATSQLDPQGIALIHEWIMSLQ